MKTVKIILSVIVFAISVSNIPMYVISGNVDKRSNVVIEYGDSGSGACEFSPKPEAQKFQTFSNKHGVYIIVVPQGWSGVIVPRPIYRQHRLFREWYAPCRAYQNVSEDHLWQNYIIDDGKPKW